MPLSRFYNDSAIYYNDTGYNYNGQVWRSSDGGKGPLAEMPTTAVIEIRASITGQLEGGSDFHSISVTNSSAVNSAVTSTATTAVGTATPISIPTSGHVLIILPNSTNTLPLRVTGSTAETGIAVTSRGPALLSLPGGTTVHVYTTGTTAVPFRYLLY